MTMQVAAIISLMLVLFWVFVSVFSLPPIPVGLALLVVFWKPLGRLG